MEWNGRYEIGKSTKLNKENTRNLKYKEIKTGYFDGYNLVMMYVALYREKRTHAFTLSTVTSKAVVAAASE